MHMYLVMVYMLLVLACIVGLSQLQMMQRHHASATNPGGTAQWQALKRGSAAKMPAPTIAAELRIDHVLQTDEKLLAKHAALVQQSSSTGRRPKEGHFQAFMSQYDEDSLLLIDNS